uniref:START domain-containing protein 10 n=1 Tax=Monodelphis domestica TaxID=13616 RepID=A0A5F8G4F0_MONDO
MLSRLWPGMQLPMVVLHFVFVGLPFPDPPLAWFLGSLLCLVGPASPLCIWPLGAPQTWTLTFVHLSVHPQCRMECRDVPAETVYDVLHDIEYRKKWDSNVIETFDIARLTVNADVGYYSWRCPKPLKNRDVITLRSWLPMGADYIIMNYSVKHPKYPPRKDLVRAVSIQTGYLIQSTGPKNSVITYLAQVDPKGSLPKWVVNKSSQFLAPKAMKKMYKACMKYPEWKQKHQPHFKPWLHPEQSPLPSVALSELSVQHADSLENIDESTVAESRDERGAGGEGSDDDSSLN